jgi:hypothetical protein
VTGLSGATLLASGLDVTVRGVRRLTLLDMVG